MNTWMNNSQYLAQVGHFFGACTIILLVGLFSETHREFPLYAYGFGIAVAAVKEFWYDMVYELPKQTWLDSIMDFFFYALGGTFALVVLYLHSR